MHFSQQATEDAKRFLQHGHFQCNHNYLAKLAHTLFRQTYCFLLQDGVGTWYTHTGTAWKSGPSIVYELRNRISDDILAFLETHAYHLIMECVGDVEYMLGNHEDKLAILAEMEGRFLVAELPNISLAVPTVPAVSTGTIMTASVGPKNERLHHSANHGKQRTK